MDCNDFRGLLPHPAEHELALERMAREKYCAADPGIIRRLFDPMTCPLELLPWLAYALSVDVWNDGWPVATKRAVCFNSLQVHTHKGTRGGVEDALAALGVTAEIVEWWEQEPVAEAGTMTVTLWVHDNILPNSPVLIGEELTRGIIRQLDSSKRASIHYTFQLAAECETSGFSTALSSQITALQRTQAQHTHINSRASRAASLAFNNSAQLNSLQRADVINNSMRSHATATVCLIASAQTTTLQRMEARV